MIYGKAPSQAPFAFLPIPNSFLLRIARLPGFWNFHSKTVSESGKYPIHPLRQMQISKPIFPPSCSSGSKAERAHSPLLRPPPSGHPRSGLARIPDMTDADETKTIRPGEIRRQNLQFS